MIRYFKKALLTQNQVKTRHGKTIPWEQIPGNDGLIALDDVDPARAELIEDLVKAVGKRGLTEINEHRYHELKKNRAQAKFAPKLGSYGGPMRVLQPPAKVQPKPAPAVGESAKAEIAVQVEKAVAVAMENTKLAGGDTKLAEAVVPPARPKPKLGRPRKAHAADGSELPSAIPASVAPFAPPAANRRAYAVA